MHIGIKQKIKFNGLSVKKYYWRMKKMTKTDLVNLVAEKAGYSKKDAEKALTTVISAISESLAKGEKIQLVGFGTFEVRERKAKEGINPKTKEKISISAKKVPVFKAGKALKDSVAK